MKLKNLFYTLIASIFAVSCSDYDAPLLTPPVYKGEANMTIKELKERYADVTTPTRIETEFIIKGYVVGNDEAGNIFKQLYIQDETGGINIGIDISNFWTTHRIGQEVYLNLHQLFILKYASELQIGYEGTTSNRIDPETYKLHASFNGYPSPENATPKVVTIDKLTDDMVNTLVRFDDIYFVNGGKQNFIVGDRNTDQPINDENGRSINVRTSNYATFANDELPEGKGSIVGVLGRYNGTWQLLMRTKDDLINFIGENPGTDPGPDPGDGDVIMNETFGNGYYPSGSRPKIADFTDFQAPAPITYADRSGAADVRSMSGDNGAHVWLPANKDSYLTITKINTSSSSNLQLSFQVSANLYNATDQINLNVLTLTINGTAYPLPSTPVSNANGDNNKFTTFTFDNIPSVADMTIEFYSNQATNTLGLRLDNIKIAPKE